MERAASFVKAVQQVQDRLAPPAAWRWPILALAGLLSGLGWTVLDLLVQSQSIRQTLAALETRSLWMTALFWGLAVLAAVFLTHSLCAGNFIVGVPSLLLAFVNYFKEMITSTPLTIGDFTLIDRLGNIAGMTRSALTLTRNSLLAIMGAALWLLAAWFFSRPLRVRWRWSLLGAPVSALAFFLLFWVGADPVVFSPLGMDSSVAASQAVVNQACGVPLGLWRSVYKSATRNVKAGYTLEYMQDVAARTENFAGGAAAPPERKQPNIIMILSESFFDVTTLPNVTYEADPVAEFHAMQKEGVSGAFYTRSLGGGTCNVEMEVMTGMNTSLLSNEDLYSLDPAVFFSIPAVPALLRGSGYYTSMTHTFDDSIYHRAGVFPCLGFDDLYFSGDFARIYPPAAQAPDYWDYMFTRISGQYYSDDLMADALIVEYETESARRGGPLFLYAVTMEGHEPYTADKYGESELTVHPESGLTGEAAEQLLQYSQANANASAALGKLADYFRDREEPTVIIFYGDHRPGLGLNGGGTVYSQLGMVPADKGQWSLEDIARLRTTQYLIWSNDPDCLPGAPGSVLDTSSNYLGTLVLDIAGVEKPVYWRLISRLSQYRLIDTLEYHLSAAGELTASAPDGGPAAEGLSLLADIMNDMIYGNQYVGHIIGGG